MIASHIGVTVREAGWLLAKSEGQVRRLLHAGDLEYAVRPTRITSASVQAHFAQDSLLPLRVAALLAVLEGRARVPAPATRYARPLPISELPRLLAQANHAPDRTERSIAVPAVFVSETNLHITPV